MFGLIFIELPELTLKKRRANDLASMINYFKQSSNQLKSRL